MLLFSLVTQLYRMMKVWAEDWWELPVLKDIQNNTFCSLIHIAFSSHTFANTRLATQGTILSNEQAELTISFTCTGGKQKKKTGAVVLDAPRVSKKNVLESNCMMFFNSA